MGLVPVFCPGGGVTSLSFIGSVTGSGGANVAPVATLPAGSAAGDLCVILESCGTSASTTISGFTTLAADVSGARQSIFGWKLLTAADITAGSITGNASTVGGNRSVIAVFRPDKPIKSVTVGSLNHVGATSLPSTQTVTASAGKAPLVVLGAYQTGSSAGWPGVGTLAGVGTIDPGTTLSYSMTHMIYNSSPADLTWNVTSGSSGQVMLESCYIQVA